MYTYKRFVSRWVWSGYSCALVLMALLSGCKPAAKIVPPPATQTGVIRPTGSTNNLAAHPPVRWQQLVSPEYRAYVARLTAAGCPGETVRQIVLADVENLLASRRLALAIEHDTEWWRMDPPPGLAQVLRHRNLVLEEEAENLIRALTGSELPAPPATTSPGFWGSIPLTGSVLGALPAQTHLAVQEIWAKAAERNSAVTAGDTTDRVGGHVVELARLRNQTHTELRQVLSEEQLAEFLVRYSYQAACLRQELRAFQPTPAEFKDVLLAIEPLEREAQAQYGADTAMSPEQRERHERYRDLLVGRVLSPERFRDYLRTRLPVEERPNLLCSGGVGPESIGIIN